MATSIKLSSSLKSRVAAAAKGMGKTSHAFMVEAIEQQTALAERRRLFIQDALQAEKEAMETGLGYTSDAVHAEMEARARGQKPRRPRPKLWRK